MSSLGVGSQLLVTSPQDCSEVVEISPNQEGTSLNWERSDIKERPVRCGGRAHTSSSRHS